MSEYVYLVQPEEHLNTKLYKIGMSKCDPNQQSRLKSYGENRRVIAIKPCDNARDVEKELIKQFKKKFTLVNGREYFEGELEVMEQCFNNYTEDCVVVHPNVEFDIDLTIETLRPFNGSFADMLQTTKEMHQELFQLIPYKLERLNFWLLHPQRSSKVVCTNVEFVRFGVRSTNTRGTKNDEFDGLLVHPSKIKETIKGCSFTFGTCKQCKETVTASANAIDEWIIIHDSTDIYSSFPKVEDIEPDTNDGNKRAQLMSYISVTSLLLAIILELFADNTTCIDPPAPPVVDSEDLVFFKDKNGTEYNVLMRGERTNEGIFFSVSDVMNVFHMKHLSDDIQHHHTDFKMVEDYRW